MKKPNQTTPPLPSKGSILKASAIALTVALVLLFVAVLPAEYGFDPTGLGSALNLKGMSETEHAEVKAETPHIVQEHALRQDRVVLRFEPGQGYEYKFQMQAGQVLAYSWKGTGAVEYDFHGEVEGDKSGAFTSYDVQVSEGARGSLTAPFTGSHGWYWYNSTDNPVTITLQTSGFYVVKGVIGAPQDVVIREGEEAPSSATIPHGHSHTGEHEHERPVQVIRPSR